MSEKLKQDEPRRVILSYASVEEREAQLNSLQSELNTVEGTDPNRAALIALYEGFIFATQHIARGEEERRNEKKGV